MQKRRCGLALAGLMVGCAPVVKGSHPGVPLVMPSGFTPVPLGAGQTVFVEYKFDRSKLKVSDERFNMLGISWNSRTMSGDIPSTEIDADWIKLSAAEVPDGVHVALAKAFLVKDVVKSNSRNSEVTVNYYERVRVVLKFTIDSDAARGPGTAFLAFKSDNLTSAPPVRLDVQ